MQETDVLESESTTAIVAVGTAGALAKAEIECLIEVAKRYPRQEGRAIQKATALACHSKETAEEQFYVLKRGDKRIEGPSIRMAEIFASCWGNVRYAARVVDIGREFITAQGVCIDLETNTAATQEVVRRITDKYGKRYGDDMIQVTANAACSLALRNAILRVVPRSYVDGVLREAKQMVLGKGVPIESLQQRALESCQKYGITEERMCSAVDKTAKSQLTKDDLLALSGMIAAIRDGVATIEDTFPATEPDPVKMPQAKQPDGGAAKGAKGKKTKPEPNVVDDYTSGQLAAVDELDLEQQAVYREHYNRVIGDVGHSQAHAEALAAVRALAEA